MVRMHPSPSVYVSALLKSMMQFYCAAKEVAPLRMNVHVAHLLGKLVGHVSIFPNSHEFPATNLTLS